MMGVSRGHRVYIPIGNGAFFFPFLVFRSAYASRNCARLMFAFCSDSSLFSFGLDSSYFF